MFGSRARYALRSLVYLAKQKPIAASSQHIAAALGASPKFIESILTDLAQRGLLTSQRGRQGGYRLARAPDSITVLDVLSAIGVRIGGVDCSPENPACQGCATDAICPIRDLLRRSRTEVETLLTAQTLLSLAEASPFTDRADHP